MRQSSVSEAQSIQSHLDFGGGGRGRRDRSFQLIVIGVITGERREKGKKERNGSMVALCHIYCPPEDRIFDGLGSWTKNILPIFLMHSCPGQSVAAERQNFFSSVSENAFNFEVVSEAWQSRKSLGRMSLILQHWNIIELKKVEIKGEWPYLHQVILSDN